MGTQGAGSVSDPSEAAQTRRKPHSASQFLLCGLGQVAASQASISSLVTRGQEPSCRVAVCAECSSVYKGPGAVAGPQKTPRSDLQATASTNTASLPGKPVSFVLNTSSRSTLGSCGGWLQGSWRTRLSAKHGPLASFWPSLRDAWAQPQVTNSDPWPVILTGTHQTKK